MRRDENNKPYPRFNQKIGEKNYINCEFNVNI